MTTITTARPGRTPRSTHSRPMRYGGVPARRVSLVDRAALRIGIALVHWSRRSTVAVHHERRALRVEQQLDLERRELQQLRLIPTLLSPR